MAEITAEQRREYENKFRRQMVSCLSPVETKVMLYIIDRTIGWMKDRELIVYREFLDGKANNYGVNVQKTSAVRAVKKLEAINAIEIVSSSPRYGTTIKVNLDWSMEDYFDAIGDD